MSHPSRARMLALASSLAAVIGVGALSAAPAAAATTGTIDATVNVPSAGALANVSAVLVDSDGQADATATVSGPTNISGTSEQFTFTNVPAGASYYVYFYDGTAADNLAPTFDGAATLGSATPVTVFGSGGTVNAAAATMVAGGEITGTLTDATNGGALTGSTVTAIDASPDASGFLNDATGKYSASGNTYTISGLPTGSYILRYTSTSTTPPYPHVYYATGGLTQLQDDATALSIAAGSAAQTVNFTVPEAGTIAGTVVAASTNSPLAGVIVQFYNSSGEPLVRTVSGSTGAYTESNLLPGSYKVSFTQTNPALALAFQYYTGAATLAQATAVSVAADGTMSNINVALAPGGEISGAVEAARGGAPLGGIGVFVLDAAGDVVSNTITAADGTYTVANLPAGTYYVEFGAPSFKQLTLLNASAMAAFSYTPEFYGATLSLMGAKAVKVTAGSATTNVNGALLPAAATKIGLPTESRASLGGLGKNRAALAFTVAPGTGQSADLASVSVKLPVGFGWNRAGLKKALSLNGAKFTYKVSGRTLTVTFLPGQRKFKLSVKAGGLTVSRALRAKAQARKIAAVTAAVTVTNSQGVATKLSLTAKRPS